MRSRIYSIRAIVNQRIWWPLGKFSGVLHPLPLLGGLAVMLVLSWSGQLHEIYIADLEAQSRLAALVHAVTAALSLTLLSAALYFANYSLSNVRIEVLWAEHRDVDRERRLRLLRNLGGSAAAMLPWIGLGLGLWHARANLIKQHTELETATAGSSLPSAAAILRELEAVAAAIPWIIALVVLAGLLVVLLLHVSRRNGLVRSALLGLIVALFVAAVTFPTLLTSAGTFATVEFFRAIGPLAMVVLNAVLLFAFVAIFALLARGSGFAIAAFFIALIFAAMLFGLDLFTVARVAMVVFVVVAILAALSWKWRLFWLSVAIAALTWIGPPGEKSAQPGEQPAQVAQAKSLESAFAEWLQARADDRKRFGGKYPVFIIAAEGGGIYAAAAATAFLSRLQDHCPGFAQHVFAISGVSGGAFGATAFQRLARDNDITQGKCDAAGDGDSRSLSKRTADVILDDHLSPLLGFTLADLLNTFPDRSAGLEDSLVRSIDHAIGNDDGTAMPFSRHWNASKAAPALVLNATSVESGYRVAFAPFRLSGLGGGSLHSFADLSGDELTLARAAVVSARFPAILPAYPAPRKDKPAYWFNLVDGGYSDASGAFTALDLYHALDQMLKQMKLGDVDLRLILLTSARSELEISKLEATSARDTLSPFITLLKVRGVFWEVAVARTLASVDAGNASLFQKLTSPAQQGRTDWHAATVLIDEETFALSLGWRISPSTQKIVSLLMGEPKLCPSTPPPNTLRANSCVMQSIISLLDPKEAAR